MNSVVEPWVDMVADIEAINRGVGQREGESYWINGRRYFVKQNGGSYPVDGPGVHVLSSGAYFALKVYNTYGLSDEATRRLDWEEINEDERAIARDLHLRFRR